MKALLFTNLWPSSQVPGHGTFVQERIERLRARLGFDYRVIHPLPRYPALPGGSVAARHSRLPAREEVDGIPVIAMELAPGGTIKKRVDESGTLSPAEAVDAVLQIADGLHAAFIERSNR